MAPLYLCKDRILKNYHNTTKHKDKKHELFTYSQNALHKVGCAPDMSTR